MIKYGKISEVDAEKGRARVEFEEDEIVSDWLPVSQPITMGTQVEFWPRVNMFVWCVMDKNAEDGVVAGALYDDDNKPPVGNKDVTAVTFDDGTRITYDISLNELLIECVGAVKINCVKAVITASESITVETPTATFSGDIEVSGALSATGNIQTEGSIEAQGNVEAVGLVRARKGLPTQVSLTTHTHPTPAGLSSAPTPGS